MNPTKVDFTNIDVKTKGSNPICEGCVPTGKRPQPLSDERNKAMMKKHGPCHALYASAEACMMASHSVDWRVCEKQLDVYKACMKKNKRKF